MMLNMFLLKVKEILTDYDPNFMAMSLDEAYLNITKHLEERKIGLRTKGSISSQQGTL